MDFDTFVDSDKAKYIVACNRITAFGHRELEKYAIRTGNDREPGIRAWFAAVGNPLYADPNFPLNSIVNPDGFDRNFTRNSTAKINDSYLLTTIKLVYHITPSIKCPKLK